VIWLWRSICMATLRVDIYGNAQRCAGFAVACTVVVDTPAHLHRVWKAR
jgi:hypothetical protein